jgi:hypothetical protein
MRGYTNTRLALGFNTKLFEIQYFTFTGHTERGYLMWLFSMGWFFLNCK